MDTSILELITELCDKHIDKRKCVYESINIEPIIKKMRAKAFEVLLKKKHITEYVNELEGNTDSICHLLAWQYTLKNHLNQPEKAESLGVFINHLKNDDVLKDSVAQNVILFLLHLRGSCPQTEELNLKYDILDKVILKHKNCTGASALPYDLYPQQKFQFSPPVKSTDKKSLPVFSLQAFKSDPNLTFSFTKKSSKTNEEVLSYSSNYKFKPLALEDEINVSKLKTETVIYDEGYFSPVKEHVGNIWEIASKLPANNHRTWESLDNIDPKKELPFACESGPKTLHLFQKIFYANACNLTKTQENILEENIVPCGRFIKYVKYMLVGMTSDIFQTNDNGLFYLKKGTCVEGISSQALKSFCNDLLFCGSCYRSLNNLCSPNSYKSNENNGYIFKELCESVKRYLAFYRVAALSFPDSANLLTVHSHMRGLRQQIEALAKVCRVPPVSAPGQQILRGAQLIDFMYREITETVDKNVQLVLYAVFYPCCQIYFSRFLQRWLFEGVVIDPYEEFIIKSETDYTKSRARVYWTRSFSLRHDAVPEFLSDLKIDILQCGKTMNLLKQCNPDASLYTHIMSRPLPLISCCLTPDQSTRLKQEIDCYYVEMAALCGPRISLYHRIRDRYGNEENAALLSLVEKKRALALKEMELRKQHEAEEKAKFKRKIFEEMKEQIRLAAEHKKKVKEDELREELMIAEQAAQIEELRFKLVREESKIIINYYNNLIDAVDKRRNSIELRKKKLLECSSDLPEEFSNVKSSLIIEDGLRKTEYTPEISSPSNYSTANTSIKTSDSNSSGSKISNLDSDLNISVEEIIEINKNTEIQPQEEEQIIEPTNFDVENANINNTFDLTNEEMYNQKNETFLQAQKNRAKIMNLEFDTKITPQRKSKIPIRQKSNLSDAQKNKLKVMSSELDKIYANNIYLEETIAAETLAAETLAKETITTSEVQPTIVLTNEDNGNLIIPTVTSNLASPGHEDVMNLTHRKKILKLPKPNELVTIFEKSVNDVTPMSVDSTPTELPTPSSAKLSLNTDICLDTPSILESGIMTGNSCLTDDGFKFPVGEPKKPVYETTRLFFANKKMFNITQNIPKSIRPMRVSKNDVAEIKKGNLKFLLYQSVYIPLEAQMKLVNSEIIKYFVNEQNFLSHLHSLRSYYFLFDGEFARHITDNLFSKLYDVKMPSELLSCRFLQLIIEGAVHASSKIQENGNRLSFIVRNVPRSFDLSSAEVFDCISLSYRINWPLNVVLPYDTIEKYDIVFKYLLKLHHMSWVLQKISLELKHTQKEIIGVDETLLLNSPQYHKIQLYRHIMTHFIQTLHNYTVSEVLQTSWNELENNLKDVSTIDQMYGIHVVYIKTIMFRCLLNRKCESIMKVIREIFVTILKFYNYLRSRSWNLREKDIYYTHPNFKKMEYVFSRFEEFTAFVFRVGNKMAKVGYQPHLIQMLDMLNVNDYYTNKKKM